jgi:hypothetical protein
MSIRDANQLFSQDIQRKYLFSITGLLSTSCDCRRILQIRSSCSALLDKENECQVQHEQSPIDWNDLCLEIIKNLGAEKGRAVLIENASLLPKSSLSAR